MLRLAVHEAKNPFQEAAALAARADASETSSGEQAMLQLALIIL